ncbi:MAG: hypothetical protein QQN41_10080 [Nitrosopumilus sp.]
MLYSKQITISANTTEANATKNYFRVNKGIISTLWITFPPGCAGLVKMRMYHEGHPFIPVNQDNYIRGDNYTFVFPVMYEITEEPMILTVEIWNDDETYEHTIDILFLILPKGFVLPVGATEGILESLKSLVIRPLVITEIQRSEL